MEPRLWVCITTRKRWAWGLHLSVASLPLSPGETTLCPRPVSTKTSSRPSPGREQTSKACRPPPSWPTFPLVLGQTQIPPESAFRPTSLILWAGRGQDRTQLICCPQDSKQREELLPRVVGAASCAWIPQRPDAPRPGLRPPGPTTVCRPPADLRHPPQGSERPREGPEATPSLHWGVPRHRQTPGPSPHHRPCLQTWGNSGSRPGSVRPDSDLLAHWCG